jgi:hypothetical protein
MGTLLETVLSQLPGSQSIHVVLKQPNHSNSKAKPKTSFEEKCNNSRRAIQEFLFIYRNTTINLFN